MWRRFRQAASYRLIPGHATVTGAQIVQRTVTPNAPIHSAGAFFTYTNLSSC